MEMFVYCSTRPWRYYITSPFAPFDDTEAFEVSEKDFDACVGYDRRLVPMHYDSENINRQNFYMNDVLIAFRVRK